MKMLFTAMLINALHAALEDAEIALNRISMDNTAAILALAVCREIVVCKVLTNASVLLGFVSVDRRLFRDVCL